MPGAAEGIAVEDDHNQRDVSSDVTLVDSDIGVIGSDGVHGKVASAQPLGHILQRARLLSGLSQRGLAREGSEAGALPIGGAARVSARISRITQSMLHDMQKASTPLLPLLRSRLQAEELEGVEGIEKAYLFGSWAARYAGEAGRAPADLDVLVIDARLSGR